MWSCGINGEFFAATKEISGNFISPIIARDSNFNDCLVYVVDFDNTLRITRLPSLETVKRISIKTKAKFIVLSDNQKVVYMGNDDGSISVIMETNESIKSPQKPNMNI